jgi:NitT/TauT family transport system substrate-binding protein
MHRSSPRPLPLGRRAILAGVAALAVPAVAADLPTIRLGLVQFGTVQWIADVIRRHGLDTAHRFRLTPVPLASPDAGRIAIMGRQAEIVVLDWPFVAVQRASGTRLSFSPLSSATGGIMVKPGSDIRSLAHLKGKRLGVAGGPIDKSWLVMQAAARKLHALDLTAATQVAYGAPPLLEAKLVQGELDAVLTYWNFAAVSLDLPPRLGLIGFVFREDWAARTGSGIDGFLAAAAEAQRILATSPAEWDAIRPLMGAPDDLLFARLRARFVAGVMTPADDAAQEKSAAALFALLRHTGGARATEGLEQLPSGVFWRGAHAGR